MTTEGRIQLDPMFVIYLEHLNYCSRCGHMDLIETYTVMKYNLLQSTVYLFHF